MTFVHSFPALLQAANPDLPPVSGVVFFIATTFKMLIIFLIYMVGIAMLTLAERKISAWIQDRHGPNRVGKGWGQPFADGLKNFMKEETMPEGVNKPLFVLAPLLSFIPALTAWCVIPFGAPLPTRWGRIDMVVADLPVGFLFILAIGIARRLRHRARRLVVEQQVRAAWRTALERPDDLVRDRDGHVDDSRAAARRQRVAEQIVQQQSTSAWNVVNCTIAFFIFMVAAFAETNRLPFDLPEAESELIAGYHSEYSAMKFSMFFIAEYANMVTASALMATLFFGGWDIPFTLWDNVAPHTGLKTLLTLGVLLREDAVLRVLLHVDPLDAAAVPLRPAHGARLEVHASARAYVHSDHRSGNAWPSDRRDRPGLVGFAGALLGSLNVVLCWSCSSACSIADGSSARRTRARQARSRASCGKLDRRRSRAPAQQGGAD